MKEEELKTILELHKKWLNDEEGGEKANLEDADLRYADLRYADLRYADLRYTDLRYADLEDTDLRYADLRNADLRYANLRYTDLRYADLEDTDLRNADLRNADLRYANLRNANLRNANLRNADLEDANLRYADLMGAKNVPFIPYVCPEKGSFTGFKKARDNYIIELIIPASAKRSSGTLRKCRADKVFVKTIYEERDGNWIVSSKQQVESGWDPSFIYKLGEVAKVSNFDDNRWRECSSGIHFFMSFEEAVRWVI